VDAGARGRAWRRRKPERRGGVSGRGGGVSGRGGVGELKLVNFLITSLL